MPITFVGVYFESNEKQFWIVVKKTQMWQFDTKTNILIAKNVKNVISKFTKHQRVDTLDITMYYVLGSIRGLETIRSALLRSNNLPLHVLLLKVYMYFSSKCLCCCLIISVGHPPRSHRTNASFPFRNFLTVYFSLYISLPLSVSLSLSFIAVSFLRSIPWILLLLDFSCRAQSHYLYDVQKRGVKKYVPMCNCSKTGACHCIFRSRFPDSKKTQSTRFYLRAQQLSQFLKHFFCCNLPGLTFFFNRYRSKVIFCRNPTVTKSPIQKHSSSNVRPLTTKPSIMYDTG